MLLMIDSYDSFTYRLVRYFRELGEDVHVVRNDAVSLQQIAALNPDYLVISPGPGRPEDAGIIVEVIQQFCDSVPILGVCLGHQALAQAFGAKVIHARDVVHGKASQIFHNSSGLFVDMPTPFSVARYHSLVVDRDTIPSEFDVIAWTERQGEFDEVMAIAHKTKPCFGVQFHPESVLSEQGHALLQLFLNSQPVRLQSDRQIEA